MRLGPCWLWSRGGSTSAGLAGCSLSVSGHWPLAPPSEALLLAPSSLDVFLPRSRQILKRGVLEMAPNIDWQALRESEKRTDDGRRKTIPVKFYFPGARYRGSTTFAMVWSSSST